MDIGLPLDLERSRSKLSRKLLTQTTHEVRRQTDTKSQSNLWYRLQKQVWFAVDGQVPGTHEVWHQIDEQLTVGLRR